VDGYDNAAAIVGAAAFSSGDSLHDCRTLGAASSLLDDL